jgi:hypothetical protein
MLVFGTDYLIDGDEPEEQAALVAPDAHRQRLPEGAYANPAH